MLDRIGISKTDIVPILEYYESTDAPSLTAKIKSIKAFKKIEAPMIQLSDGSFAPDWNNRYFTEDIPFGLLIIKSYAVRYGIDTPTIDKVLEWAQTKMGKQYMVNGKLTGRDTGQTIIKYTD